MRDAKARMEEAWTLTVGSDPARKLWIPRQSRPSLASLPANEQLRERLLQQGARSLADAELLALLLRETGSSNADALAPAFLQQLGGTRGLLSARPNVARARKLGDAEAAMVMAVIELGSRLWAPVGGKGYVSRPEFLVALALSACGDVEGNCLGAILFAPDHRELGTVEILRQEAPPQNLEAGPLLREALRKRAAGVSLFCIRPGGAAEMLEEDRKLLFSALAAFWPFALELRDYLIITSEKTFHTVYQRPAR